MPEQLAEDIGAFRADIRAAVNGLWAGRESLNSFLDRMVTAISRHLRRAWREGAEVCGIAWNELSQEEIQAMEAAIMQQAAYLPAFAQSIMEAPKGTAPLSTHLGRADLWINQYNAVKAQAQTMACADQKLVWVLGPTEEHCLTAGMQVLTQAGPLRIAEVVEGHKVWTRHGWRAVTRTHRHIHREPLLRVCAQNRVLEVTPEHRFWTRRGWVVASALRVGEDAVLLEKSPDIINGHIRAPDALHRIATSGKIFVTRAVSGLLRKLSLGQRLKAGMSVPIIPVGFNDKIPNADIYDELVFDRDLPLEGNAKRLKDMPESLFKTGWSVALIDAGSMQSDGPSLLRMLIPEGLHFSCGLGVAHRIVRQHGYPRPVALTPTGYRNGQSDACLVQNSADRANTSARDFSHLFGRMLLIQEPQLIYDLFGRALGAWRARAKNMATFWRTGLAANTSSIDDVGLERSATDRARDWLQRTSLVATCRTTEAGHSFARWINVAREWLTTVFTNKLFKHVSPPRLHYSNVTRIDQIPNTNTWVFNLTVDGLPEFVAEGFLVHNCPDCARYNGRVYRASTWARYDIRPQSHGLACHGYRCLCVFEPTTEPANRGRPPAMTG